jgi:hypothetical protein
MRPTELDIRTRYGRRSSAYRRDYQNFPSLQVVRTSERAERFAHQVYLAQEHHAGRPLRIFLTTTGHIGTHPDGILGAIWRVPGSDWRTASSSGVLAAGARPK